MLCCFTDIVACMCGEKWWAQSSPSQRERAQTLFGLSMWSVLGVWVHCRKSAVGDVCEKSVTGFVLLSVWIC